MQIFRLDPILDDPKFEGFGWDIPSLTRSDLPDRTYDFTHFVHSDPDYEIPSLKAIWDNPTMTHEDGVRSTNDFPCCNFHVPIFSEPAVDVLSDYLTINGELLPVVSSVGKYSAYQTLTIVDGLLDVKRTVGIRMSDDSPMFFDISTYVLKRRKRELPAIFRIREHPSRELVSADFKQRVEESGLQGFSFPPL